MLLSLFSLIAHETDRQTVEKDEMVRDLGRKRQEEEEDKEDKKDSGIHRYHCAPLIMELLPLIVSYRIGFLFRAGEKRHHCFVHRMDEKIYHIDRIRPPLQKPFSKLLTQWYPVSLSWCKSGCGSERGSGRWPMLGLDLSMEAWIWAFRMGFEPRG